MGRPRAEPFSIATPERILEAATTVFAEEGLERATLADIGARAGIRRPSLLYHFESKEALYADVVRRTFADLRAVLGEATRGPAAFEVRLEQLVRAYATFLQNDPRHARIVVRSLLEHDGPGAALLVGEIVPVLDIVLLFIARDGATALRPGLDLRGAVLQVASDMILRNASGALRRAVWGEPSADDSWKLARALLLAGGGDCSGTP